MNYNNKYISLSYLRKLFRNNQNIYKTLKEKYKKSISKKKLIEISYDIQTGSYISMINKDKVLFRNLWIDRANVINKYLEPKSTILEIGVGEFTNHCGIVDLLNKKPKKIYVCDISVSRLIKGIEYQKKNYPLQTSRINPFCSDIKLLPLPDSSVDLIFSTHALEPNKQEIKEILRELFRVAKKRLIFFEPSFKYASKDGKKRIKENDFIPDLDRYIKDLGGKLIEKFKTKVSTNDLNPTACYVVEIKKKIVNKPIYTTPGTNFKLDLKENFYQCREYGLHYPIFHYVPIFREQFGIFASVLIK